MLCVSSLTNFWCFEFISQMKLWEFFSQKLPSISKFPIRLYYYLRGFSVSGTPPSIGLSTTSSLRFNVWVDGFQKDDVSMIHRILSQLLQYCWLQLIFCTSILILAQLLMYCNCIWSILYTNLISKVMSPIDDFSLLDVLHICVFNYEQFGQICIFMCKVLSTVCCRSYEHWSVLFFLIFIACIYFRLYWTIIVGVLFCDWVR